MIGLLELGEDLKRDRHPRIQRNGGKGRKRSQLSPIFHFMPSRAPCKLPVHSVFVFGSL